MNIIKLSAIDSTNDFLKKLKRESILPDFTVVITDYQLKGKGQRGTHWESESGKNLMISVLKRFDRLEIEKSFYISMAISIAVFKLCLRFIPESKLSIKWPNDILSGRNKLAGILIENSIQENFIIDSVIGLGLNVNQKTFSSTISNVSSLSLELGKEINLEIVLQEFLEIFKVELLRVENHEFEELKSEYESLLYKKDIPTMFKDHKDNIFLGKITGVSDEGNLIVELQNEVVKSFSLKEIALL